ncbi:MAG TPA: FHA domain-containing protein [Propionibacteriaceae bacterium]|jgi:pSer/pThr/pTyr-binding forkhead associated (FHA) protein
MADLIVTLLKVAFLAVLWLFVLLVANVIRTDLFRTAPAGVPSDAKDKRAARSPEPRKRSKREAKVLAIDTGSQAGTRLALVDEFRIGRSAECALILDDDYVSGDHASLARRANGDWVVTDLGSTNGTFVNEVRVVTPTVVTASDSLRIGRTQMRLET